MNLAFGVEDLGEFGVQYLSCMIRKANIGSILGNLAIGKWKIDWIYKI
jgi:hypothetical protein